jgi:hypothetical protein
LCPFARVLLHWRNLACMFRSRYEGTSRQPSSKQPDSCRGDMTIWASIIASDQQTDR